MCSGIICEPGGCPVADGALSSGSDGSGMAIISTNILKEKKIKVEGATGAPPTDSTPEPSPSPSLLPKGEADTPPSPPLVAVSSPKALRLGMRADEVELYPGQHPEGGYPPPREGLGLTEKMYMSRPMMMVSSANRENVE